MKNLLSMLTIIFLACMVIIMSALIFDVVKKGSSNQTVLYKSAVKEKTESQVLTVNF